MGYKPLHAMYASLADKGSDWDQEILSLATEGSPEEQLESRPLTIRSIKVGFYQRRNMKRCPGDC